MKTGNMPTVTQDSDVNGKNKTVISVDATNMMLQSSSRSRGGEMNLKSIKVNPKDQMC